MSITIEFEGHEIEEALIIKAKELVKGTDLYMSGVIWSTRVIGGSLRCSATVVLGKTSDDVDSYIKNQTFPYEGSMRILATVSK